MPHSSGGGSSSGGSHGGSGGGGSYGGGGGGTFQVSRSYFPGSRMFVRYAGNRPEFWYTNQRSSRLGRFLLLLLGIYF